MSLDVTGFALVATILTISPGQDTFLVLRNATLGGFAAGIGTTAGVCSGLFLHATLSALGLSAIIMSSAEVFSAVKFLGATYLIWLGLQSLVRVRQPTRSGDVIAADRGDISTSVAARQGFLSNALNPRTAAFYLALLPQFAVFPDSVLVDSLALAGVHFVIAFAWLTLLAAAAHRGQRLLRNTQVSRAMDFIAGVALLGFGLRLAFARR
ncbi:MAG: LysE family translocator [Deltaproteobacteria bacterium]|nr:LysE family translocator [Deltaproteobacteria bacterium]MBI3388130.1 LysE family translocator [Deltaproteobacteria bacterium]